MSKVQNAAKVPGMINFLNESEFEGFTKKGNKSIAKEKNSQTARIATSSFFIRKKLLGADFSVHHRTTPNTRSMLLKGQKYKGEGQPKGS